MKRQNILLMIYFLAISFAFSACQKSVTDHGEGQMQITPTPDKKLSIRNIDFKNYTYSDKTGKNIFTLENGEQPFTQMKDIAFSLKSIEYADLTDDKEDEAIIRISIEYGAGSSGLIYVFSIENQKPKIIWYMESGYGARGGLMNVYSENRDLIIQLFGDNKFIELTDSFEFIERETISKKQNIFNKFRFRWNGEKFTLQEKTNNTESNHIEEIRFS